MKFVSYDVKLNSKTFVFVQKCWNYWYLKNYKRFSKVFEIFIFTYCLHFSVNLNEIWYKYTICDSQSVCICRFFIFGLVSELYIFSSLFEKNNEHFFRSKFQKPRILSCSYFIPLSFATNRMKIDSLNPAPHSIEAHWLIEIYNEM